MNRRCHYTHGHSSTIRAHPAVDALNAVTGLLYLRAMHLTKGNRVVHSQMRQLESEKPKEGRGRVAVMSAALIVLVVWPSRLLRLPRTSQ